MDERRRRLWRRVGWACRYGHIPLSDAMSIDSSYLEEFSMAVAAIVKGEQPKVPAMRSRGRRR